MLELLATDADLEILPLKPCRLRNPSRRYCMSRQFAHPEESCLFRFKSVNLVRWPECRNGKGGGENIRANTRMDQLQRRSFPALFGKYLLLELEDL